MTTPFFTLDLSVAERAARGLASAAGPRTVVAYAVKVNPQPDLLATFSRSGLWAEVVSLRELDLALRTGFPGAHVIVNGPAKGEDLLAAAVAAGATIHLESLRQVELLSRIGAAAAAVGLRIRVPCGPQSRFGIPLGDLSAATDMLGDAGVTIAGLHAHFTPSLHGAAMEDWECRARALRAAARHMKRAAARHIKRAAASPLPTAAPRAGTAAVVPVPEPPPLRYLDWGGGLMAPDIDDPSAADFRRAAEPVMRFVEGETAAMARELDWPWVCAMVEPGRFLAEHAGSLKATCLDAMTFGDRREFVLDAGIGLLAAHDSWLGCYKADSYRAGVQSGAYRVGGCGARGRDASAAAKVTAEADFAGPSCMEEDVLPKRPVCGTPEVGGRVTLTRCGAYNLAGTTTFYHDPPSLHLVAS